MDRWILAVVLVAGLGLASFAGARSDPQERQSAEYAFGHVWCSTEEGSVGLSVQFQASNGILGQDQFLYNNFPAADGGAPGCDMPAEALLATLAAGSCAASDPLRWSNEWGEGLSFQFSCGGSRSQVVHTLAAVAQDMILSAPR